ncbi:MAG: hypothetical protein P5674_26350, partial [Limnospira sp. PMC 289.06]|nr:hypothetical protein [Limnospira sp. PMC 289.06]
AAKIDALDLAQRALFDVLNFAPDFAPAQQMLQGIEAAISEQSQALDHLNLKDINLIVFPDWNQPEDSVAEDLAQVI